MVNKKIILWMLIMVLLSANVLALGVSPVRKTIDFEPHAKHEVSFTVFNEEHRDVSLLVYLDGEFSQYVKIEEPVIDFKADEPSKTVRYEVKLPKELPPGKQVASIVIREIPKETFESLTQVSATLGIITQLVVNVPYPGKYLQIENLDISEAESGKETTFLLPVTNLGTEKLLKIKGTIDILGPTNERVATVQTQEISLQSKKRELLKTGWTANVNPGKYYAVATVMYDGKSQKIEKEFNIGKMDVEVVSVETKNFRLGDIAKMDILLRSHWNEKIEGLYGTLLVKDETFDPVSEVQTASVDIEPHSEQEVQAYWDTHGLKEGTYYMTLKLHFLGITTEKQFVSYLGMDYLRTSLMSATGQTISAEAETTRNTILSVAIIILIIMNLAWFFYFKKKLKGIKKN